MPPTHVDDVESVTGPILGPEDVLPYEVVTIESLTLDPENSRTHNERNLRAITDSLLRFGLTKPIVVRNGVVIAGNGTLLAAQALGWTYIAVSNAPEHWSDDDARAYAIADNRTAELAGWDPYVLEESLSTLKAKGWDIVALGFDPPKSSDDDTVPVSFDAVGHDISTEFQCPSCHFSWSGSAKPKGPDVA